MDALATTPMPKRIIIMGIQAIGGIVLTKSKTGFKHMSAFSHQAIRIPSGTPITAPKQKPSKETLRLAKICWGSVEPSGFFMLHLPIPVSSAFNGDGRSVSGASFHTSVTKYQIKKKPNRAQTDIAFIRKANCFLCFVMSGCSFLDVKADAPWFWAVHPPCVTVQAGPNRYCFAAVISYSRPHMLPVLL